MAKRSQKATVPNPFGPAPHARHVKWHEMEFYGFLHFTVNTFTDKEWGYGDEAPTVFNPTAFDAEQIVGVSKDAGMRGLILTCKHHDGFCLWPSRYTEHSVKNSSWRNGKGDVLREISGACAKQGVKFGVYLSPWDRNHAEYGRPAYITYYRKQLRELLSEYGPIFEVWFDGANGGDGFYGGARETRTIDRTSYYDWENTWSLVRELQPDAVMFSDVGPDVRWVGNESGYAGDPCWATYTPQGPDGQSPAPGFTQYKEGEHGHLHGKCWLPAEVDVSIRPGWFYHQKEDEKVRTPQNLLDLYYQSVGRGASLLLNLPPDRRGIIHEKDVESLRGFRKILDATFGNNLACGATVKADNVRGNAPRFAAENVLDGRRDTFWCTDDGAIMPELVLDLGQPATFNVVSLREHLPLGLRVDTFALDQWQAGEWQEFASGTGIGSRRLWRGAAVTTGKVRLRITRAAACPAITDVGLYAQP
ncbi:MAG: alpha-L-fucosidase [Lentisphaerae bacterium RIFOXYA12_64_32]|nr:MAG: alpha-L-fucosidase [Lentisphaerae bacterium RIFOXYA12_64_32]